MEDQQMQTLMADDGGLVITSRHLRAAWIFYFSRSTLKIWIKSKC